MDDLKDEMRSMEPEPKLPRASIEKIISETLSPGITCSKEVKQILLNSCVEFVHILATEANEICEREQKKTVTHEHIYLALQVLGYGSYVEECAGAYKDHAEQTKLRPSKQNKFKDSGLSRDELERQQEELFKSARLALHRTENEKS